MSMNRYMHPRNIYKEPPNFKQLALEYPEFRKYTKIDVSGKVSIDFKNVEALRALSVTLLKKDFNLDLDIPLDKLIPTIPLRLNYILWIEDLLSLANRTEGVKGIDIGTGASCVYPLIAARKNNWSMVATEIDPSSIEYANKNVARNCLENLIKVTKVSDETLLTELLTSNPVENFDFCMCNPPFFGSTQELHPFFKSRKQNRPHPKNAFCASVDEVVVKGGEVEYISKLVKESGRFVGQIRIYTTMVGHKSSLPPLKKLLRETEVVSFKQTEFCQGNTTRWGLAWTFVDIDLRKIPSALLAKNHHKPLVCSLPKFETNKLEFVVGKVQSILSDLQFKIEDGQKIRNYVEFVITGFSNTWSHQRRQRREKMRLNDSGGSNSSENDVEMKNEQSKEIDSTCSKLAEMDLPSECLKKRELEDDSGFYNCKKMKTNDNSPDNTYLKARIKVARVEENFGMELHFIEGIGTKEALHQVLQYIKNQLKQVTDVK